MKRRPGTPAALALIGLLGLLGALAPPAVARADAKPITLTVEVHDEHSGNPVSGAQVEIDGNDMALTNAAGEAGFALAADTESFQLEVDAPGYLIDTGRVRLPDISPGPGSGLRLNRVLRPLTDMVIDFTVRAEIWGWPILPVDATLRFLDRDHPIRQGHARVTLDAASARLREVLTGQVARARVAVPGYESAEAEVPIALLSRRYRNTIPEVSLFTRPVIDQDRIEVLIESRDARTGQPIRQAARIELVGFEQGPAAAGSRAFVLNRSALLAFTRAAGNELRIVIEADGYQGPARDELPISDLLAAMDRGQAQLVHNVILTPVAGKAAIGLQVAPARVQAAAAERVTLNYQVVNHGDVALERVLLIDPQCRPVRQTGGDGNGLLASGEIWRFECTQTVSASLSRQVTVQAESTDGVAVRDQEPVIVTLAGCPVGEQTMPELTGLDLDLARTSLQQAGLKRVSVSEVELDHTADGSIVDQQPAIGDCVAPDQSIVLIVARQRTPVNVPAGPLAAQLECADGLEITAGARPSRTCWLAVRNWAPSDNRVKVAVTLPSGTALDVWPLNDSAWPPNMHNPGVADLRFKERYIFTLFFSAPVTAMPGIVPVGINVSQAGHGRVDLSLDVNVLPPGRIASQGSGIRPPVDMATGSGGDFCVWRSKAFADPPNCFQFNIAACGTPAYDGNARYERVGSDMTNLEASALMSRLSVYGGNAYGCRQDVTVDDEHPPPEPEGPLRAELECADGLEITAGARPSRTCWLAVRDWAPSDNRVKVAVTLPSGTALDVWPLNDSAWPPNMHHPGVADLRFKERYIFSLFFSAPVTATPGIVPVGISVSQAGHGRVDLSLDVNVLPPGRLPSQGSGIRPPVEIASGSGDYCVWRYKAFGDPPPCFLFNIAACGTAAYDGNARYERVGQNMAKLEASVLMSRLSRYGGDAYGCLAALNPPAEVRCPDGSTPPAGRSCPQPVRVCPDGTTVIGDQSCPPLPPPDPDPDSEPDPEPQRTCQDGSVIDADQVCPAQDADGPPGLDCSVYGPQAELYWDNDAQEHLCRCRAGYSFHISDRCVPAEDIAQCLNYPGTYPADGACQCLTPGHYWSQTARRCLPPEELPDSELADCSAWPGTLPLPDPASGDLVCTCPVGTRWSDDLGRCATQAEEGLADIDCSHRPGTVAQMDYFTNTAVCACPGADETWDADSASCTGGGGGGQGGGGIAPVGDDPDPPPPDEVQAGQCNDQSTSGNDQPVRVRIPVVGEPAVELIYETYGIKDRVRAFVDGQLAFDSGCVGTRGNAHQTIPLPASAQLLEIDVYPNCEGTSGTDWNFTVNCSGSNPGQ